jgi:nitrite reductase/ring-hydroxylating ferredoxin subunit
MQENFAIIAEQGLRDAILVRAGDEMSAIEDKCPNLAICCSDAS